MTAAVLLTSACGVDHGASPSGERSASQRDQLAAVSTHDAAAPTSSGPTSSALPSTVRSAVRSSSAEPERLVVAAAGIDEPLTPGGLSGDGTVNPGRGEVTWFTGHDRKAPGARGTAVVAGHVSYRGMPDVFADLEDVAVGDEVELALAGGAEWTYVVTTVEVVSKVDLQRDARVWGQHPRGSRLVLVTCDDELGYRNDGHRAANLVVIAERAPG